MLPPDIYKQGVGCSCHSDSTIFQITLIFVIDIVFLKFQFSLILIKVGNSRYVLTTCEMVSLTTELVALMFVLCATNVSTF